MYVLPVGIHPFICNFDLFSIDFVDTSLAPLLMQDILHFNVFSCCLYFVSFTSILLVGIDILLEWSEWSGWRRRFFVLLPQNPRCIATQHKRAITNRTAQVMGASHPN
jgi:hypothetical protein